MKNKSIIALILIFGLFFIGIMNARAETFKRFDDDSQPDIVEGGQVSATCDGIFTEDAWNMIQEILGYFRILAPAVLIVMIGIDLITAVMSMEYMPGKDDSIRKAVSKISLRIIAAILLFFVPTIITIVMNLDGVKQKVVVDSSCMDLY